MTPSILPAVLPVQRYRAFRRRVRDAVRGETPEAYFDLRNAAAVNAVLARHGLSPFPTDSSVAEIGPAEALSYLVGQLVSNRRLNVSSPFVTLPGLSPAGAKNVASALAEEPGLKVRRVFELREDLRDAFPLALTPKQRGEYLGWLVSYGVKDFGITPAAAVWFLFELDADPTRGLAATYRLQPAWQMAVPHGLTHFGWDDLKAFVARTYGFDSRWLRAATLPEQMRPWDELQLLLAWDEGLKKKYPANPAEVPAWAEALNLADRRWRARLADDVATGLAAKPGVNVLGLFRYTSGLQQAVRGCVASLQSGGVRTSLRDYPVPFLREPRDATRFDGLEQFGVTLLNTGLDTAVPDAFRKSGLHPRNGVYRIGHWWWEMEEVPAAWHDRGDHVDEIWAPTRFIADAMARAFRKPVTVVPPALELPGFDPLPKGHFGMDPNKFTVAFVFDMNSRMQRKNPLALIRAFRRAFSRTDAAQLVIKVSPPESYYRDQWNELRDAAADAGVTILDRVLTRGELLAFLNAADCYASLHRSEGLGLTCAEAMLLGKPTVATAYSGNLDFMTDANSYLVRYGLVRLEEDIDPYPRGAVWADVDVEHAAETLRHVYEQPRDAKAKGERAKREVARTLSPDRAGRIMAARLAEIRENRARTK